MKKITVISLVKMMRIIREMIAEDHILIRLKLFFNLKRAGLFLSVLDYIDRPEQRALFNGIRKH